MKRGQLTFLLLTIKRMYKIKRFLAGINYTVSQKTRQLWQAVVSTNMTNFDIFGQQHQHTFRTDLQVQLSLYLHFLPAIRS